MSTAGEFVLWHYAPSLPAAAAFCALFGLLATTHLYLRITRGSRLYNPIIVGGIFEIIGYVSRAIAHSETDSVILYAVQSLFLLLAPILFAASVYMFLGHLVRTSGHEQLSIIPARWITRLFVGGDVTCFIIQAGGGGILSAAKSQDTIDIGNYIILAGLILQIAVFVVFIWVASMFHARSLKRTASSTTRHSSRQLVLLYTTSILITARNVYRVLEYGMGQDGYLIAHEWTLYVFDAGLMTLVMLVTILWYATTGVSSSDPACMDVEDVQGIPMHMDRK